jgi:hypothetical protein
LCSNCFQLRLMYTIRLDWKLQELKVEMRKKAVLSVLN